MPWPRPKSLSVSDGSGHTGGSCSNTGPQSLFTRSSGGLQRRKRAGRADCAGCVGGFRGGSQPVPPGRICQGTWDGSVGAVPLGLGRSIVVEQASARVYRYCDHADVTHRATLWRFAVRGNWARQALGLGLPCATAHNAVLAKAAVTLAGYSPGCRRRGSGDLVDREKANWAGWRIFFEPQGAPPLDPEAFGPSRGPRFPVIATPPPARLRSGAAAAHARARLGGQVAAYAVERHPFIGPWDPRTRR